MGNGFLWNDYVDVGYSTKVPYLFDGKNLEKNRSYELRFTALDESAGSGSPGGNFVLTTREIKDNCGDDLAQAKTISTGTVNGAIEIAEDQDWMKFTALSTDKYRIKLTNKSTENAIRYAIKGKKIYYSWQSWSGKNHYKQMKLNGKSKKNASTLAKNKYKASNAKGYSIIEKKGTSTSKIYLKTPKKKNLSCKGL